MIELLAPAGDLEKLKIAVLYGADAVYIGGKKFSLRARASNFSLADIESAGRFARRYGVKIYVTLNIVPRDEDLTAVSDYLRELVRCGVDGIIVTSLYYAALSRQIAPELELHLSTQFSAANSRAINYYKTLGFSRVILAREVTINQIKTIKQNTGLDLEVFIHGGMCSSFSGRCVLSNYLTGRDANRGGCAHSCRWNYYLSQAALPVTNLLFNMGSKDLSAVRVVPELIDLGIKSLKIEGRMKSIYYIATVVRSYRQLIDEYLETGRVHDFNYYEKELAKAENRETASGFLYGLPDVNEQLYNTVTPPDKTFVGIVLDYDSHCEIATVEQRNYFSVGDRLELFGPNRANTQIVVDYIWDEFGNRLDAARHPQQRIKIKVPFYVSYPDMIRLII
ncbi:MAG: U32 family peptidase [Bacilli bacterium]|nr:U32 family peptidase [Bacilli bacterium]